MKIDELRALARARSDEMLDGPELGVPDNRLLHSMADAAGTLLHGMGAAAMAIGSAMAKAVAESGLDPDLVAEASKVAAASAMSFEEVLANLKALKARGEL